MLSATRKIVVCALMALLLTQGVVAHDSWLAPLPPTDRGEAVFALSTGEQFPAPQVAIPMDLISSSGCRSEGLRPAAMRWVADGPTALLLRSARPVSAGAALTCWAQLKPVDISIDDATAEVYLKEVNATLEVRARWAALRARGVRWQETYTKHARIEVNRSASVAPASVGSLPIEGLGLDIRIESPQPLRAGGSLRAQVLRDGQPLAGLPVELRSDLSPVGWWRTTDAEGRLQWPVPLAARWLLRATELRSAVGNADRWESRFATLAFEVLPKQ